MRSAVFGLLLAVPVVAQQAPPPATLAIDDTFLVRVKKHPDPTILNAVRSEADHAMDAGPFSVMEKKDTPTRR
jgi:hypothetical protein